MNNSEHGISCRYVNIVNWSARWLNTTIAAVCAMIYVYSLDQFAVILQVSNNY